jgi:fused signal recognition particle receptor
MVFNLFKASYQKFKNALSKTRSVLGNKIRILFGGEVDESKIEALEELLYEADLGVKTASALAEKVRDELRKNKDLKSEDLIDIIKGELLKKFDTLPSPDVKESSPYVILVVGVNGNGKTTSCAKLAHRFKEAGKNVMLGAADTFRAAAAEQLTLWADKLSIPLVKGLHKSDPSSVVFDTVTSAKAKNIDIVLIDTAGRLHTKTPLMQELEKIRRSCQKVIPDSPHEVLLVLDSTVGQNAIDQAKIFSKFTPITGLILTKLDGSAKGGVIVNICEELKIPVKYIGVGESIEDLEPFDAEAFISSLF